MENNIIFEDIDKEKIQSDEEILQENDAILNDNPAEIQTITVQAENNDELLAKLDLLHTDLGFICCFIVFFVLVVLLKYVYKFFDMFFYI